MLVRWTSSLRDDVLYVGHMKDRLNSLMTTRILSGSDQSKGGVIEECFQDNRFVDEVRD